MSIVFRSYRPVVLIFKVILPYTIHVGLCTLYLLWRDFTVLLVAIGRLYSDIAVTRRTTICHRLHQDVRTETTM